MSDRSNKRAAVLFLLRAGVYPLVGPFVAGIAHQAWLMRIGYFYDRVLDLVFDTIVVIIGTYVLGWKVAVATGLVMGLFFTLVRWQPISLVASILVGGAAGAWLIGPNLWLIRHQPDWHDAALGAFAALFSTWVIYRDRYLRPRRHNARSLRGRGHSGVVDLNVPRSSLPCGARDPSAD